MTLNLGQEILMLLNISTTVFMLTCDYKVIRKFKWPSEVIQNEKHPT